MSSSGPSSGFPASAFGGGNTFEQQQPATPRSLFVQLLSLLILFGFSLLSAFPNLFSTPPVPDPRFSFETSTRFNLKRTTQSLGVQYRVNSAKFSRHPIAAEIARSGQSDGLYHMPALRRFEENVDHTFTRETLLPEGADVVVGTEGLHAFEGSNQGATGT
jgi:DnaJ family protein B protein 12